MADDILSQYRQYYEAWLASKDLPKGTPTPTTPISFETKHRTFTPSQTVKALVKNPLGLFAGPAQSALHMAEAAADGVINVAESVRQNATPQGWMEKLGWIDPNPIHGSTVGQVGPLQTVGKVANAAMLGLPGAVSDQVVDAYARSGEDGGKGSMARALGQVAYDMLPVEEALKWMSGQDEQGNPVTSEQLGQALVQGAMEAIPLGVGLKAAKTALTKGVTSGLATPAREIYTKSQLQDAASRLGDPLFVKPVEGEIADTVLNAAQHKTNVDAMLASKTVMDKIVDRGVRARGEGPIMSAIMDTVKLIDDGTLGPDHIVKLADDLGVPADVVVDHVIDVFGGMKRTSSAAGRVLYDTQRLNRSGIGKQILDFTKSLTADEAKLAELDALAIEAKPTYLFSRFNDLYKRYWLKPERGLAITQPQTFMRNIETQLLTTVQSAAETFMTDSMLAAIGKGKEALGMAEGKSIGEYFHGTQQQLASFIHSMKPSDRAIFNEVMEALPGESKRLLGSPVVGDVVLRSGLKKAASDASIPMADQIIDRGLGLLNTPNTAQEMFFRRLNWEARANGNLARLGYKGGVEEILPMLKTLKASEALDPKIAHALGDATDHSLKMTYAYTPPEGTFGGAVLKMYKDMPMLADTVHLFPRYLSNQYRHLWERNPLQATQLFNKEFRDTLFKASNGELAQREAAMVMAKAVSGTVSFGAALAARALPGAQDYKYYQVPKGDGEVVDVRGFQPFSSYLFYADMARALADGRTHPANLTPNEVADAIAGIRNMGDVPIFAIDDIMRRMDNSDPTSWTGALARLGGRKLGIFLTPMQTILDAGAATGADKALFGQDWATQKDTGPDPLLGPLQSRIPGARDLLLPRSDPFASGPAKNDNPGLKQLGVTIQALRPLEQLTQRLGIGPAEMVGQYDNPEANNLVAKHMGEILSMKNKDGVTAGDAIAKAVTSKVDSQGRQMPDPLMVDFLRKEILAPLRQQALQLAMAENRSLFMEHVIKNQHSATLLDLSRRMKEINSTNNSLPYDPLHLRNSSPTPTPGR